MFTHRCVLPCAAREGHEPQIKAVTGLPVAPLFSASKMRWLLDNTADGLARAERGKFVSVPSTAGCCGS
jgi:glycerol kinase